MSQACDFAAAMIQQLAGGEVLAGAVVGSSVDAKDVTVAVKLERINQYLGTDLTVDQVDEIFTALGFTFERNETSYQVNVPPRRWDISIEADLIEEVARIYGYNQLPSTLPSGETVAGSLTPEQKALRKIRTLLEGDGLNEAISYALTTEEKSKQFTFKDSVVTRLDWPMTEDRSVLRMNIISGLLDDVQYNVARRNTQIALYEVGRVFYQNENPKKNLPLEEKHIAFALSGQWQTKDWQTANEQVDFYHAKGILD